MGRLVARRVALMGVVTLLVSLLTFAIVNVLPGDVASAILGEAASPDQIATLRRGMGLDLPLAARYLAWIVGMLRGDFGTSLAYGQPIAPMLAGRLGNSLVLASLTLLVAVPTGIGLGVAAALRPGRPLDRAISGLTVALNALPEYVSGLVLILAFSIWLPILPGSSLLEPGEAPLAHPLVLVLPVAVLTLGLLAHLGQLTRAGMIAALESAYVRTAILKGLPAWRVVLRHALPNVLLPTITDIGMNFGYLLGGIVVVETLFAYAGIGQLMVASVGFRDVPVIEAAVLLVSIAYGIGNLLADLASIALDPRLRA